MPDLRRGGLRHRADAMTTGRPTDNPAVMVGDTCCDAELHDSYRSERPGIG